LEEHNFFDKYHIDPLEFDRSGLKWELLKEISEDYSLLKPTLDYVGRDIVEKILKSRHVHSINYRIKKDEHLIEKIIRKKIKDSRRVISIDNYQREITDLTGIRALHLFKEDWIHIHDFIKERWNFSEQPVAYIRNGDSERIINYYMENECRVSEHPYGYRSVHYIINSEYKGKVYPVEIQVRTIFEEAWGEIDHEIRYPYHSDNELLFRLSSILNRIAGSADELGTYIRYLKVQMERKDELYAKEITDKNSIIENLKNQINSLSIEKEEKSRINEALKQLESMSGRNQDFLEELPWLDSFIKTPLFRNISSRIEELTQSDDFKRDVDAMQKAQSELIGILNNPEELKKLLSDRQMTDLINRLNDKK